MPLKCKYCGALKDSRGIKAHQKAHETRGDKVQSPMTLPVKHLGNPSTIDRVVADLEGKASELGVKVHHLRQQLAALEIEETSLAMAVDALRKLK